MENDENHIIADDRIAQHNGRFNELQVSRASLEAELEMQRQIATETKREFDKFMQSFYKKGEEAQKARSALVEIEKKLLSNNEMVLQQQNRIASLEVANRVLSEDTDHARSTIARLEGELKVHQEMAKTHETLISVLGDAERRLQLGEDLKITRLESLLESTTIERDQLRVTNQNLSDQLTHASRLSSEAEKRLSGERDHLMAKLNETQAANKEIEDEMVNLRAKLDVAQKQAALYESSNVAHNPERLANRNTYLETQVEELRVQLAESDAKLKRREQELAQLSTTSDSVEASLRQHTENSSQTISQLNSLLRKAEQRNVELTSDLAVARDELQRESENFTAREAQWNNDKTTLEQRIAIIEVQLANSESVKEDTQRRLNEARSENTQDKEKVNELEQNINQLQIDRDGLEVNLEGLRTQLSHTTIELQNANARVVEEARAREAAVDAEKTRQKDAEEKIRRAEENLLVAQSRTEELVQHIANLSNELSVREAQLSGQATEGVGVISEGSVQSLHQVLRFLREEKEKAQERLMQAEIDEKRKAIESEELRVEKNRIAETLRQREAEAEQNKAALAQRSELITRLQKMASIAKENTMLKGEKEKLTTAYSQLNNKAITLDRQVAQLQEDKAKAEQNAASATALAEARQAELEVSRKKIGETAQQKINNMMKAVEEARARAEKFVAEKDAETLKVQEVVQQAAGKDKTIKTLELKVKDTENRHQQVVALAKSLRDQRDKLKQQVDGKTPIEPVQNESMQKKQEEIQQLQEQVNDLTQKLEAEVAKAKALHEQAEEEKNEASFRSTAMSNMVKKTQDRLTSLTKELEAEKEAHARTRAEAALQQAAVQPSSSHPVELPPAPTPVISQSSVIVPSVPTPTSASGTTSTVQHMTETVPHVPSSSVTRQTDAHPTVPSAQQSIFSPFSNQPSTFRTTPSSAVFGSTTLFQAQTSSNLLPTSSSTVTVSAPQSSSPTPSVPMVASFFGTRPATIPNRGSSSFTFASSAAPADPAPAISTFSSFATTTTTKPVISIGESSHLSATQPQPDSRAQEESSVVLVEEDLLPPTDGVSQDGLLSAITSSSGEGVGGRKRTATGNETDNEAKRQRESPGEEQITSSERLHDEAEVTVLLDEDVSNEALEEIPGEDEDLGDHDDEDLEGLEEEGEIGEMEEGNDDGLPEVIDNFEDDDDDIQEVPDHPLQHQRMQRQGTPSDDDIQVLSSDTDEGDGATDSEDDQGIGRMDEEQGDEEEAEDFDYGEGAEDLDDEEAAVDFVDDDGEAEVIQGIDQSDHDAGGDVDEQTQDAENVGDDLGDLGEEREAASAMEEADDEREDGEKSMRAAEDEGIAGEEESDTYSQPSQSSSTATSHAGRQAQMRRAARTPISYDLVPTSSNESTEPQSSSSGVAAAQRRQRPPMSAGLYVTPMNRQQTAQRGGMISGRGQPQMARRGGAPGLAQRARRGGGRGI
ncbi:unnamed protein product, partial [Mesorhabditis belari]|uniref:Nucleoprotein TPR n=1 Tax=Mesorhabditis belari TaxID=2138241 RepID=A0AAF3FII7_9BILA